MMLIFGMNERQIDVLSEWLSRFDETYDVYVEGNIAEWRRVWRRAGGTFPATEAQALFLKPRKLAA